MTFEELKKEYVKGLVETEAFLIKSIDETPFTLRSGKKSYMFLDHSKVASSPQAYIAFIDVITYLLKKRYTSDEYILCNVDSKISAQMVGSVAYQLQKPQIIFKSSELTKIEKGPNRQLTGKFDWTMPVAILDDVTTGGDGTAKNVGDLIRTSFPNIDSIEIFVGFVRELKESTYRTHYVLTRDELIDRIWKKLSSKQQQAVEKERKSKAA